MKVRMIALKVIEHGDCQKPVLDGNIKFRCKSCGCKCIFEEGKDVTVFASGHLVWEAIQACKLLEEEGISAEIIDARSIVPFNYEKVIESVKKTGRIIIAGDATARGSFLNDLAANITDLCFDYLDAAPVVLGSRNWITPCHELEEAFFPQPEWFIDAINEKMVPLKDHTPVTNMTGAQFISRAKKGI